VISTQALELRAGARLLVKGVTVRINSGDRIGFVGRNGAGKSTLAKVLAGETMPAGGAVNRTGKIGYLPQDPRTGDEPGTVIDRILSARDLDQIAARMRSVEEEMATAQGEALEKAMDRYTRVEAEFSAAGGYAATAEAEAIATSLGVAEAVFGNELSTLSGGQRRRIELARILFSGAETLLLDEPTNHLDADSIMWLREFLSKYSGGLVIISHDVNLIETVVNKVFYLDANRNCIDVYNLGWRPTCCNVSRMSTAARRSALMQKSVQRFCKSRVKRCVPRHQRQPLHKACCVVLKNFVVDLMMFE
jgi:ATPase subunit of ABC transporter with duplicated ATPase domains